MKIIVCLVFAILQLVSLASGQTICVFEGGVCRNSCQPGEDAILTDNTVRCGFSSPLTLCCKPSPSTTTIAPSTTTTVKTTVAPLECGYESLIVRPRMLGIKSIQCEWPWMVSVGLQSKDGNKTFTQVCSGVLISKNRVLTTDSCFKSVQNASGHTPNHDSVAIVGDRDVAAGDSDDLFEEAVKFQFADVVKNPSLDLAVFKLEKNLTSNLCVIPACLADNTTQYMPNVPCFMAGWGNADGKSTVLRVARTNPLDHSVCEAVGGLFNIPVQGSQMCAKPAIKGQDACAQGDHGGMMVCPDTNGKYLLRGVISKTSCELFRSDTCSEKAPLSVFVDVAYANRWIREQM